MTAANHFYTAKKAMFTVLAVVIAAYVFIILLTYSPNDPSWSRISSDMGAISNMGGASGAWMADLLYTFFGWSAWWVIAILAYEALGIWWQREQTIVPLRIIAYIFMILASCGLFAILAQWFGFVKGNGAPFGGILGAEVSYRLSSLITEYGATAFLLIFTVLTATFAFDLHWQKIGRYIFSLSWLGNGVRGATEDNEYEQDSDDSVSAVTIKDENTENSSNIGIESESKGSPLFKQLKLNLPENEASNNLDSLGGLDSPNNFDSPNDFDSSNNFDSTNNLNKNQNTNSINISDDQHWQDFDPGAEAVNQESNDPALNHVLDEFLVNSGISESILTMHREEALQAAAKSRADITIKNTTQTKQEPSFAWNDQNAIDELLDENALPEAVAQPTQNPADFTEQQSSEQDADNAIEVDTSDAQTVDESQEQYSEYDTDTDTDTDTENSPVEQDGTNINDTADSDYSDAYSNETYVDDSIDEPNPVYVESVSQPAVSAPTIDLTPSNTPPSNPKKPHEVVEDKKSDKTPAPTIQFATPEDGSGNQIEDMVPDTDDEVVLPEIHDDTAFARSSRAMQTAKYRESLSPIPSLSILDKPDPDRKPSYTKEELAQLSELLEIKLQEFNVKAEVVNAIPGPVVTRFEVDLAAGVKASKVTGISRDLARSLSMASLRVVEVIPGKPYIGIEVPNKKREMVRLIELLKTEKYQDPKAQISMAMGKDIGGKPIITDLARAPHMLVAGTTGSGKSVLVNSMLLSMLLKYKPSELRLILIDPKQLELANYNDIPHLLTPVVTDMNEAASSLSWCVAEMERRYQLMSLLKVRKLGEFNKKVIAADRAGKPMIDPLWRPNDSVSIDQAPKLKTLPMIVIVADEFADMIMQVGKQAEELITRLAQKSRAAGIHLMLATQRPSVDVITGLIKANIPVRAALRVNSKVDSRTILDAGGAEDMLGNGDMLFLGPGQIEPERVHGAYVSDEEVNRVCDAWRERGAPDYIDNMTSNFELTSPSSGGNTSGEDDALYDEAVAFVMETRKVSASSIQRKFSIGYNRAARIVDSMEEAGLVSAMGKSGKRELLM